MRYAQNRGGVLFQKSHHHSVMYVNEYIISCKIGNMSLLGFIEGKYTSIIQWMGTYTEQLKDWSFYSFLIILYFFNTPWETKSFLTWSAPIYIIVNGWSIHIRCLIVLTLKYLESGLINLVKLNILTDNR